MEEELRITYRNLEPQYKESIEGEVRELAAKLETFYPGIISCRVVVEEPHRSHQEGNLFKATVTVNVPGRQIVASRERALRQQHENIYVAVHHAFDEAARQLGEHAIIQHGEVKAHDNLPYGIVSKLFPAGYGFIETFSGREIYFHRNSVLDGFEKLKIGTEVRFNEEEGEKGPQASTVKISRKKHLDHRGR